jgi:ABC-type antimicrobial peptide transport system permease subunit
MGGAIGLVLSYLISAIVNHFASGFLSSDLGVAANISVIPWWLALAGILFAMLVGIISGYAPANRAVKISALTAIKQD